MITDIYVFRGIEETAKLIKKKIKKPLYLLRFAVDGQWNLYKNLTASKLPGKLIIEQYDDYDTSFQRNPLELLFFLNGSLFTIFAPELPGVPGDTRRCRCFYSMLTFSKMSGY